MKLRAVARIARWETRRSVGTVDRRTVVVLILALLLVAPIGYSAATDGIGLEDGLYRVDLSEESPYAVIVEEHDQFVRHPDADVIVHDEGMIEYRPTPKGETAMAEFRSAIVTYNDGVLIDHLDEPHDYPVRVSLQYRSRTSADETGGETGGETADPEAPSGSGDSTDASEPAGPSEPGDSASGAAPTDSDGPLQVPDVGAGALEDVTDGTPGSISPPFPFQSLVLAFLFVVPMNFVIQAYGSTIMDERIKRRGELLLVAPVGRADVIAGKTTPYLLTLLLVTVAIAAVVGGGALALAAVVPIALCFLAATFVGAMFARSFKELTFVTVTISVGLTTYVFVPAIFTDVTPIALISPLTIVVRDLQGEAVTLGEYAFSTGPFYLCAAVLFALGGNVYREEDMFSQKTIPSKLVDALASQLRSARRVSLVTMCFVPFVFAGQLLVVALLFALPFELSLPILLVVFAGIEEVAKSLHIYAGLARNRFDSSIRTTLVLAVFSGFGFFLAEKATLVVQLVGLPDLEIGQAAFGPTAGTGLALLLGMLLAPLVLHVVTTAIAALGARRNRFAYAVGLVTAVAVHAAYNLGVIVYVGV